MICGTGLLKFDSSLAASLLGMVRFLQWKRIGFQQFAVARVGLGCYSQEVASERGAGREAKSWC